jgi:hypothetical protein
MRQNDIAKQSVFIIMSLKNYFVKVNSKNLQWTGHYEIFGK